MKYTSPRPAGRLALASWAALAIAARLDGGAPAPSLRLVRGATTVHRSPVDCPSVDRHPGDHPPGGGGVPGLLANGRFDAGLEHWSAAEQGGGAAPGGAAVEEGAAMLREGDSFLVTLSQTFSGPAEPARLKFTVRLEPGFDRADAFLPDAFEVSILDAGEKPLIGSWDPGATSFLNFQEDGTVHAGPEATWDGATASVDLSAVPPGAVVTLYFDFIGADHDTAGGVTIDDVGLETIAFHGFIRGNVEDDGRINITDPIDILGYLFLGSGKIPCLDAADTDNNGRLEVTDAIFELNYLFLGGEPIPAPFPVCGPDQGEADQLECVAGSCPTPIGG